MLEKIQNLIHDLQEADRETKKRWLVGSTLITGLVVISFWAVYVSFAIKGLRVAEAENSEASFSEVFFNGLKVIKDETFAKLQELSGQMEFLGLSRANLNFVAEGLEEIQPKRLISNY
jgi:hypothetical protein